MTIINLFVGGAEATDLLQTKLHYKSFDELLIELKKAINRIKIYMDERGQTAHFQYLAHAQTIYEQVSKIATQSNYEERTLRHLKHVLYCTEIAVCDPRNEANLQQLTYLSTQLSGRPSTSSKFLGFLLYTFAALLVIAGMLALIPASGGSVLLSLLMMVKLQTLATTIAAMTASAATAVVFDVSANMVAGALGIGGGMMIGLSMCIAGKVLRFIFYPIAALLIIAGILAMIPASGGSVLLSLLMMIKLQTLATTIATTTASAAAIIGFGMSAQTVAGALGIGGGMMIGLSMCIAAKVFGCLLYTTAVVLIIGGILALIPASGGSALLSLLMMVKLQTLATTIATTTASATTTIVFDMSANMVAGVAGVGGGLLVGLGTCTARLFQPTGLAKTVADFSDIIRVEDPPVIVWGVA